MSGELKLPEVFRQLGVSNETLHKVRFGGVVGKIALIAITAMVTAGGVALRFESDWLRAGGVLSILLGAAFAIRKIVSMVDKEPGVAILEGAELLLWRQQQLEGKGFAPEKVVPGAIEVLPMGTGEEGDHCQ